MNLLKLISIRRRILLTVFVTVALLLLFTAVRADQGRPAGKTSFSEKMVLLTRPPENATAYAESIVFNTINTKMAYVTANDEGMRVIINQKIGKLYDHIARGHPIMAPETDTIGYLAEKNGRHYAVIGNRESPAFDGVCCLGFSPNGKYSAYIAQNDGRQFVVMNGRQLRRYEMIDQLTGVRFSPDSGQAAYIAVKDGRQIVVHNGKEQPPFDNITEISFSPDSSDLAYIAVKDKNYYIMRNEKPIGPFDNAEELAWSPDGKHLTAVAVHRDRWIIIKNEERLDAGPYTIKTFFDQKTRKYNYMAPRLSPPEFSPDSSKFAFVRMDKEKFQVVVNGKSGPALDWISAVFFSPDSRHFAYIGVSHDMTGKKSFIVFDGKSGRSYDQVGSPFFSPDGRRMAYQARKGSQWRMVTDQQKGDWYEQVGKPVFSPDGQRLAYQAYKNDRMCIVTDQQEGDWYDEVSRPYFSPDASTLIYWAQKEGKDRIVENGREHPPYDQITHLLFSPDSSRMAYKAKKGDAWLIIRNGREGRHYQDFPPEYINPVHNLDFSPGNHLIYTARTSDQLHKTKIVIDEQEGSQLFLPVSPFEFISENHCHAIVGQSEDDTDDDTVSWYRLEIKISE